jgi:predicted phage tail protein
VATPASTSQINLTWTDNSNNESGFKIERCTGTGCTNFTQIAQVGANVKTYSNSGRSSNTTYLYRVRAFNGANNSGYSNTASATTSAPAAPNSLTATAISTSGIDLVWNDNSNNETGFRIERCSGSSCTNFSQIAQVAAGVTTYASRSLSRNTTYRYRVRAYNAVGNSSYSNIASARTRN